MFLFFYRFFVLILLFLSDEGFGFFFFFKKSIELGILIGLQQFSTVVIVESRLRGEQLVMGGWLLSVWAL
jgi:hypothetical protein